MINQLIAIFWLGFVVYWLVSARGVKRSLGNNTRAVWFRISGVILILLIFQAGGFRRYEFIPSEAMRIAGLILMMLGFAFAIWARIHLGRNWGMPMSRKQEPELVTSGPYALVRHPIYSGI